MPLRRGRWPFFAVLVVGGLAISALWYAVLANPRGEAVPASGGRYIEGVLRNPERINPLFASANQTDADAASLIFSGLVRLDADGTPKPDLAERWEVTNNGQSYVFHLRGGVQWQDGAPFDAEDVLFTFQSIAAPGFKGDPALAQLMQGVLVTARDPATVEFQLEETYAPFLSYLTIGILPKHLLEGLDPNQLYNAPFNARPVGTGPYAFDARTDTELRLSSNATYYLGPPLISDFDFRSFDDAATLSSALRSHSIDGAFLGADHDPALSKQLEDAGGYTMRAVDSTSFFAVYLDTRSPQFADAAVRHALQQAVNVASLVAAVPDGAGSPTEVGISPRSWAYTHVSVPPFDPGAAARALESAGWSRGRDGVRERDGTRLTFTLATTNDPQRLAMAQQVASQWRAVGVDAQVQSADASTYIEQVLLTRNFQAALVLVDPGADPDPYPFWHSRQIVPPGRNLANYSEPRIDDVLQRARQTTDPGRREELYALFAGYLIAAMPWVPLYSPVFTYVQSDRVHGFSDSLLTSPASRFDSVAQWYIETRIQ